MQIMLHSKVFLNRQHSSSSKSFLINCSNVNLSRNLKKILEETFCAFLPFLLVVRHSIAPIRFSHYGSDCLRTILTVMWFSSSCLCKAAAELVLFFSLTGITLPVRAEVAIATNQATAAQGITTADSRIHYVIGIGSALLIGIILGNVVYFWRRAERIERELDELREQRIARARGKIEENDNLFV